MIHITILVKTDAKKGYRINRLEKKSSLKKEKTTIYAFEAWDFEIIFNITVSV